jgi:hypothetical protein
VIVALILAGTIYQWPQRWAISGHVIDEGSGRPIAGVSLLLTVSGEERSLPDVAADHDVCVDTVVVTTDAHGEFGVARRTPNFQLAHRFVDVAVLKPSPMTGSKSVPISDWDGAVRTDIYVSNAGSKRWSFPANGAANDGSPESQQSLLRMTTNLLDVARNAEVCNHSGWPFVLEAFDGGVAHANTRAEKEYAIGACESLQKSAARFNSRRYELKYWRRRWEPDYEFPYKCDDSLFVHAQSSQAVSTPKPPS